MSKYRLMLVVIALLLLANIARWYFAADTSVSPHAGQMFFVADYKLKAVLVTADFDAVMRRDVFKSSIMSDAPSADKPRTRQATVKATGADISPPEQNEIAQIRLLGVVVRESRPQAYLAYGGSTYLVYEQDMVANRFYVARVAVDTVEMLDQKLNIRKTIPLSGR